MASIHPVADRVRRGTIALAALAALATVADAQPIDHEARGYELATAGKLAEALEEFEAAYQATRAPQLLFAMGRMHSLLGDCARAKDHFQRFLATQPGPKAAEAAQTGIDTCKPAAATVVAPPPPRPPTIVAPPPPPSGEPPPRRRSFASALAGDRFAQLGVGAGLIGAGLFVYSLHLSCWDGVCDGDYADFEAKRDRAPLVGGLAIGVGAVGGALLLIGAIRQAGRRGGDDGVAVTAAPTAGGGMLGVAGAF